MVKVLIGVKGTGKTKSLIEAANKALKESKGSVVCIEKGDNLRFDISSQVRLVNTVDYLISDAQSLYGFVAGLLASNHDITDIFVDSYFKICNADISAFEKFLLEIEGLTVRNSVNILITASMPVEEATDIVKKFI